MNAWPFLVARGRRRGYAVLLAPGFLQEDYGLLEEVVGPVPAAEPVQVAAARTRRGQDLNVVWSEHRITGDDLADGTDPRDEHSRPLRLLYGFVCREKTLGRPSDVDISRSLAVALDSYRRFLADEQRFTVESSAPFELGTAVPPAVPPPLPVVPPPAGQQRRRYGIPLALVGVVAGIALGIVVGISVAPDTTDNSRDPICTTSVPPKDPN